jgi:hypothetical protein
MTISTIIPAMISYPPITITRFSLKATPGAKIGCGYEGNFFQPKNSQINVHIKNFNSIKPSFIFCVSKISPLDNDTLSYVCPPMMTI